ncbi:MAG: hypothetical protein FJ279_02135 [Planctomycetes bacterium]|nr:hypothetical protein [Planctomycetota bacterium]
MSDISLGELAGNAAALLARALECGVFVVLWDDEQVYRAYAYKAPDDELLVKHLLACTNKWVGKQRYRRTIRRDIPPEEATR